MELQARNSDKQVREKYNKPLYESAMPIKARPDKRLNRLSTTDSVVGYIR
jgi:hypothetical protein